MPKRQIILLVLMVLALAYAGYELLGGTKADTATLEKSTQEFKATVTKVQEMVTKSKLSDPDAYRLQLVDASLRMDPFVKGVEDTVVESAGLAAPDLAERLKDFAYRGMISVGTKSYAIINDNEYTVGESIEETGFRLAEIRKDSVLLLGSAGAQGAASGSLVVPMQDDFVTFVGEDDAQ